MKIHVADSQYTADLPATFITDYKAAVKTAFSDASKLLPFGSKRLNFFVQPRIYGLIKETGDNGHTHNAEFIELAFDPTGGAKSMKVILGGVRSMVFHEMNHAARFNIPIWHYKFLDNCILEGLATAFARDYAGDNALWAQYPPEVTDWIQEIIAKNDLFDWRSYSFDHPDGRRWIAYKVGTYIVDQAAKNSKKSILELSEMECADILKLAKINVKNYKGLT